MRWCARPPSALAALVLLQACGVITNGVDLVPADAGPEDVEVIDMGPPDTGEPEDMGVEDVPVGDGGDACTPIPEPAFPAAWPFPATMGAYTTEFYDAIPGRETSCSLGVCHGGDANPPAPPLIPNDPVSLAMQTVVDQAMAELWMRAQPGTPESVLVYSHTEDVGPNIDTWIYTDEQLAFVRAFVMKGEVCKWKGVTAGPGECPPPTVDTSHCGP